jgi:hypothetical protein
MRLAFVMMFSWLTTTTTTAATTTAAQREVDTNYLPFKPSQSAVSSRVDYL